MFIKMQLLDQGSLDISDTSRNFLLKYIEHSRYFVSIYEQIMTKAIKKLTSPIDESTFIDYGGGTGILSCLAKEIGFKTVVYNDINKQSVTDARVISRKLDIEIDFYISGDIEEFIEEVTINRISPDLICSIDVLEHIYDLEFWISTIFKIKNDFSITFMTSANPCNPYISHKLKRLHNRSEHIGMDRNISYNETFLNSSMSDERRKIIKSGFPD